MSTSFVDFVEPPGIGVYPAIDSLQKDEFPPPTPGGQTTFLDALLVRKCVFVDEQKCRLDYEVDADDRRAFHWVVHASISTSTTNNSSSGTTNSYGRRKSAGGRVPVGTVRLVPSPHGYHPAPGSVDGEGGELVIHRVERGDRPTKYHDGREAYVKIGRLATVKEYRGLGLGRLLVNEALQWAIKNKDRLESISPDPIEREKLIDNGHEWKGLVMAHAQITAVNFYQSMGFQVDEELGKWIEEGIEHVAMWKRLTLQ